MRVYLDSAPIIYLVEQTRPLYVSPDTVLITSDLARLECRVKPIRDGNQILLRVYERFFQNAIHEFVPLSPEVIDLATDIRAHFGFTTPDAIHLAAERLGLSATNLLRTINVCDDSIESELG